MIARTSVDVARRCLCLELLLQRLGLETDSEDPIADREEVRRKWLGRLADLEIEAVLTKDERSLLERPVGELSEEELDDLHGRASGALVFLWALGRLDRRPTFETVEDMADVIGEHGILGTGSISRAKETAATSTLRPEPELRDALAAYARTRGKAKDPSEPEKIVAGVAAHHLEWILDRDVGFDDAG